MPFSWIPRMRYLKQLSLMDAWTRWHAQHRADKIFLRPLRRQPPPQSLRPPPYVLRILAISVQTNHCLANTCHTWVCRYTREPPCQPILRIYTPNLRRHSLLDHDSLRSSGLLRWCYFVYWSYVWSCPMRHPSGPVPCPSTKPRSSQPCGSAWATTHRSHSG